MVLFFFPILPLERGPFFFILPRLCGAWPFFSNSTMSLWSVVRFFLFYHVSLERGPFFLILPRLFGVWPFFCNSTTSLRSMVLFFFLPSISESVGTKCTYRDCHRPLVQSVCTVIVRVLWHKVYLLPLLRSFGTKCTDYHWIQCHFHSPLAESVSTVIVRVFWHKLYLPSLSQFFRQKVYPPALSESFGTKCIYCHCQSFGTKCTHPHCHSPLAQSLSTVIVRLLWHKRGPFFSNSTTFLWSVAFFL